MLLTDTRFQVDVLLVPCGRFSDDEKHVDIFWCVCSQYKTGKKDFTYCVQNTFPVHSITLHALSFLPDTCRLLSPLLAATTTTTIKKLNNLCLFFQLFRVKLSFVLPFVGKLTPVRISEILHQFWVVTITAFSVCIRQEDRFLIPGVKMHHLVGSCLWSDFDLLFSNFICLHVCTTYMLWIPVPSHGLFLLLP